MNSNQNDLKSLIETVYMEVQNLEGLLIALCDALGVEDSSYTGAAVIAREKLSQISDELKVLCCS